MALLDFNTAKPLAQSDAEGRARSHVDVEDIKARLDPRAFVQWLFSGRAFCTPREARIGDTSGTPGASLSVALTGADAGLWHDHATGEGGDLIALYMAHMGYQNSNFQLALKEIASDFLGDPVTIHRSPYHQTANERIAEKKQQLGSQPRAEYLELGAPVASWKYHDLAGNITAAVERYEPDGTPESKTYRPWCFKIVDGKRVWRKGAPELRPLYNLAGIANASSVVLVEGEKCAQALIDIGVDATTAMQGAEAPINKTDWSPLNGKSVTIWPDNDEAGLSYARKAAEQLKAICSVSIVPIPSDAKPKWDAADCLADGGDPRQIIATAQPLPENHQSSACRLYTLEELENIEPPEWLIDGILTEGGIALLWAGSDSFKTFFAIDIGMCIATGAPWHGRTVKSGLVVYVAAEDESGVKMRMVGWRETRGKDLPRANLLIHRDGLTLTADDGKALVETITALPEKPKLIVIDTLARTFGTGSEDKTAEMNSYVLAADRLEKATGATVLIVHHSGRDTERERGNAALRAACHTIIAVKRSGERLTLINTPPKGKQKNAEPFADIHLKMTKVHFCHAGQERSTLVVTVDDDPRKDPPIPSDEPRRRGGGPVQSAVLKALIKAAKQDRHEIGMSTLIAMTNQKRDSIKKALETLIDQQKVTEIEPQDSNSNTLWRLTDDRPAH